jgi:L-rhamnose-H+ transport protein
VKAFEEAHERTGGRGKRGCFSSIWGLALGEWKGASSKSKGLLLGGLAILVFSTVVIGYGNWVSGLASAH